MKYLAYYTIGGSPEYANVLNFSIKTLYSHCENKDLFDVMVMCDRSYVDNVRQKPGFAIQHFHITDDNKTPVDASMRKVEIFDFPFLDRYDKILYLDCDITVGEPLSHLMNKVTRNDAVYVIPEGMYSWDHNRYFYCPQDKLHDSKQLAEYAEKKIYAFNAGQFAFRPSDTTKQLFDKVVTAKRDYDPRLHFYEQGFMNYYFNLEQAVDYSIGPFVTFVKDPRSTPLNAINHFADATIPGLRKLAMMMSQWASFKGNNIV